MFRLGTRIATTYHPSKRRYTDETIGRGMSSEDRTLWNPGNTWRTQIAILGTERQAGSAEGFERVCDMHESAGKTL